jgi:hypothetical protein
MTKPKTANMKTHMINPKTVLASLFITGFLASCHGSTTDKGMNQDSTATGVSTATPTDTLAPKDSAQQKADSMMKSAPDTVKAH